VFIIIAKTRTVYPELLGILTGIDSVKYPFVVDVHGSNFDTLSGKYESCGFWIEYDLDISYDSGIYFDYRQGGNTVSLGQVDKAIHLIIGTQWTNPTLELPENNCTVYVRTPDQIALAEYRKEFKDFKRNDYFYDDELNKYGNITGWMLYDNATL